MECGRISQVLTPAACDGMSEISAGDLINLSKCCTVSVLYPDNSIEHDGENEDSLVCLIDVFDTRILMTGDIGTETEEKLISAGIIEDIDILKVAHHGSSYSTCSMFLDECDPEYAVISVGRHNDYGHPAPDTMRRLRDHEVDIYTTAECGAVTVEIGNRGFSIRPYYQM
jgi:beta-lactamase superfamily II metal-dependent hydrolase